MSSLSVNHYVFSITRFTVTSVSVTERLSFLHQSRFAFFLFYDRQGEGLITVGNNRNDNIWLSRRWSRFAEGISFELC